MNRFESVLIATVVAAGSCTATPANAVDRQLVTQANGTGVCQAALPNYEGVLRKRPLAIQNEGSTSSFVNCSPVSFQYLPVSSSSDYQVVLVNRSGGNLTIDCTGVVGTDILFGSPTLIPKSTVVANNNYKVMKFTAAEISTTQKPFNFQCLLPPGTGISTIWTIQILDVGS